MNEQINSIEKNGFLEHFLLYFVPLSVSCMLQKAIRFTDTIYTLIGFSGLNPDRLIGPVMLVMLSFIYGAYYVILRKLSFDGFFGVRLSWKGLLFFMCTFLPPFLEMQGANSFRILEFGQLIAGLTVAFFEEFIYRGVVTSHFMSRAKNANEMKILICFSAFYFGISHLGNAGEYQDFKGVMLYVFYTSIIGLTYEMIFLECESILPTVFLHFTHNYVVELNRNIISSHDDIMIYVCAAIKCIVPICALLMIVFGSGLDAMFIRWRRKWKRFSEYE